MNEKERIEAMLKSIEMLDDAIKFYELIRRLHTAFLKVLTRYVEELEAEGGGEDVTKV